MTPAERAAALEEEFSRLKARADTLDAVLAGSSDEWLGVQEKLGSEIAEVTINAPLAEARQTALALATIGKTLAALGAGEEAPAVSADPGDEIAAARQRKLAEARVASGPDAITVL